MSVRRLALPAGVGATMGAMLLAVSHDQIVTGQFGTAAVLFGLAHVAVIVALFLLAKLLRPARLSRMHRPSVGHFASMMGAAIVTAGLIHLIHGGPV